MLEALLDERTADAAAAEAPDVVDELEQLGLVGQAGRVALAQARTARPLEWVGRTVTQAEALAAFVAHCAGELDEVEVLESGDEHLLARWRREVARVELRAGFIGVERLVSETPTLLLGDLEPARDAVIARFLDDAELRARIAVLDLARLEKIAAVRSSVFVYLEWFLRDAYGVKVLPAAAFTQGLVDRGIISLGMG